MKSWLPFLFPRRHSRASPLLPCCAARREHAAFRRTIPANSLQPGSETLRNNNPKSHAGCAGAQDPAGEIPFVDIHSHHWNPTHEHVDQLVKEMDTINLQVLVNLSGGTGEGCGKRWRP